MNRARPALVVLEEAVHLLRMAPARIHLLYGAGTIPFLLGFLFFWTEMGRNVQAEEILVEGSLGIALLFVWMKCWQAAAASELLARCARARPAPWTWRRVGRMIYVQGALQPTKLVILPLAALLTLPFAWACAFYHQLAMFGDGTIDSTAAYRKAREVAGLWPGQNFKALALICLLGFFVFLNIYMFGAILPELVRKFSGFESTFAMSSTAFVLNSTFFAAALAIAHLCLNPITMAFYVVRCFHARSVRDGRDLLAALAEERNKEEGTGRKIPARAGAAVRTILIASSFFLLPCSITRAAESADVPAPARVAPAEIDRSLKETFERREFAWRMPRDVSRSTAERSKGSLAQFFDRLGASVSRMFRKIGQWISDLGEWWRRVTGAKSAPTSVPGAGWTFAALNAVEWVLYLLLALSVAVGIYVAYRQLKARRSKPVAAADLAPPVPVTPDLQAEHVLASQLPEDEWLRLARELAGRGEYRLALRALFLGTLARLAGQGVIAVARHKSNRDYLGEVRRRERQFPAWPAAFGDCVALFERSWYGHHSAGPEVLAAYEDRQSTFTAAPPPVPAAP